LTQFWCSIRIYVLKKKKEELEKEIRKLREKLWKKRNEYENQGVVW